MARSYNSTRFTPHSAHHLGRGGENRVLARVEEWVVGEAVDLAATGLKDRFVARLKLAHARRARPPLLPIRAAVAQRGQRLSARFISDQLVLVVGNEVHPFADERLGVVRR